MQRHTNGSLTWLTFELFAQFPKLVHGIFLRHGGVSTGNFASLNFALQEGENPQNIQINKHKALQALNLSHSCSLSQYHSKTIIEANPNQSPAGDGLITSQKDLTLLIKHADCQAAIFYDPIHHALANIHCGWRGNVQNIYKETIDQMHALYNTNPADLHVGISPSLGPEASEFINYKTEFPESFHPFQYKPTYFNLWQISRAQLEACGILPHHIEIASLCTYANPDDFFSYRRQPLSGRNATLASLK